MKKEFIINEYWEIEAIRGILGEEETGELLYNQEESFDSDIHNIKITLEIIPK